MSQMIPDVRMHVSAPRMTTMTLSLQRQPRSLQRQDRTGALSDDTSTPKPPSPQATIGTQTDETNQPQIETLLEKETPPLPIETTRDGPDKPKDSRTQCKGWRRVDRETPNGPEPEFEDNLWATLPFAEATWRPTYRMRAVISTDDVDP